MNLSDESKICVLFFYFIYIIVLSFIVLCFVDIIYCYDNIFREEKFKVIDDVIFIII